MNKSYPHLTFACICGVEKRKDLHQGLHQQKTQEMLRSEVDPRPLAFVLDLLGEEQERGAPQKHGHLATPKAEVPRPGLLTVIPEGRASFLCFRS